jgi:intracellular multiplication protein IcmG
MADNDQFDDEYQYSDPDTVNVDPAEENDIYASADTKVKHSVGGAETNIKRNAIIVIALVVLAMIIYKFLGSVFSSKKISVKPVAAKVNEAPKPISAPTAVKPIVEPTPIVQEPPKVEQKLSAMEISQQSMRSDVNQLDSKVESVGSNVNQMVNQIEKLNQMIEGLNGKTEAKTRDIDRLRAQLRPKHPKTQMHKVQKSVTKYYVQALIPGRAWLISSKGTTLTVREGSSVPGYGIVKLIDPHQGRVLTSSGQVLRFSQSDS